MPNKFKNVLSAAKQRGEADEPEPLPTQETPQPQAKEELPSKGRGRPAGKRSDPDYAPTTVFLKKATLADVKVALIKKNNPQDVSDVIQELLEQWVKKHKQD